MIIKYRSEIDGLRALAVLPVIFFHAGFSFFSGGFLGVDVFFVISGYLITTIIIRELNNNTFSLNKFYERRARRILPALIFIILIFSIISFIFLARSESASYFKSVIATLLFFSNFYFYKTTPYFQFESDFDPLIHTWSLSIEEQFYIIFPITLLLFYKFFKRYIFVMFIFGFVISLIICQFLALKTAETLNFYFTLSRAWELALGAICAYIIMYKNLPSSTLVKNLLSTIGIILIISSIFFFNRQTIFPSFYTLVPTIGTSLVILFADRDTFVNKILSIKLFVGIGLISYSLYLWHQPLLAFSRIFFDELSNESKLSIILISLIFSYLTFLFVETPFRKNIKIFERNFFIKIFSIIIIINLFSLLIAESFKPNIIHSTEAILAKKLSEGFSVAMPGRLEMRNFSKFKILYHKNDPKNIIIGSSRIAFIGENLLQENSLNLSVGTATLEDQIALTMLSISTLKPQRILLSADPWLFNKKEFSPQSLRWKFLEKEYYTAKKIINEKKTIIFFENILKSETKSNFIYDKINILYNFVNIRQNKIYNENYFVKRRITYPDGTEKFIDETNEIIDKKYTHFFDPYEESLKKKQLFEEFIFYLLENKIEPVFLLIPIYETSYELSLKENDLLIDIEKYFIKFATKNSIRILGSYNPKKVFCNKSEFTDIMHPKLSCIKKIINNQSLK